MAGKKKKADVPVQSESFRILDLLGQARTKAAEIEHLYMSAMDLAAVAFPDYDAKCAGIDNSAHDLRYEIDEEIETFREHVE